MVLIKDLERRIKSLIRPYEELLAVVVCDVEGACILKVIQNMNLFPNANFHCQKLITCAENLPKLKLGECRRLLCTFERHKVMIFNHKKIVLALFATSNLNSAVLKTLEQRMIPICDSINRYIKDLPQ